MASTHHATTLPPSSSRHFMAIPWVVGLFFAFAPALVLTGCGADDVGESEQSENSGNNDKPGSNAPSVVTDINTVVHTSSPTVGEPLDVECEFLNPDGVALDLSADEVPAHSVLLYPDDAFQRSDGDIVPVKSGSAQLACQSRQLGLTDSEPASIDIDPSEVHTTVAMLNQNQIVAGDSVHAACAGYDAYGNLVEDADFELVADTSSSGIVIDNEEMKVSMTTTGIFTFHCHIDGVQHRFGDPLEVVPDLPSDLYADAVPNQQTYGIGQVITVGTVVQDRFGNNVNDAPLHYEASPAGQSFGDGRFRFDSDGVYTLSVEVTGPTHADQELYEEIVVLVNATGPDINCTWPADGAMVDHYPGSNLDFEGTVSDDHDVDSATVNGESVTIGGDGSFSASIDTRYGINFVDIAATDEFGEENVRTCAFLVSDNWAPEDQQIDDAISLQLRQDAIDDKNYQGSNNIRSLNDLIKTVINSDGLRDEIESQIMAGNPYPVDDCGFDVYVNAVYFDGDSHISSLDLVGGGLDLFARFNDIHIDLTLTNGSWYCFGPYHPTIILEYVEMDATTELLLSNNVPLLQLDEVNYVDSGEVSAEGGNWFSSWVYDSITTLFQGTFRDMVEDTFEDAVTDNFDALFVGLMNSFDIDSLSAQFDVPTLDGNGGLTLDFGFGFSYAGANSARALFGIAPVITAADGAEHGITSLGVAYPQTSNMLATPTGDSASGGVHVSLLNQALHALWRGGLFHADVGGALGDDLPDGTTVELSAGLPPVVVFDGSGGAELMLGAVEISLTYPGIFDEPVTMMLGATATTDINLNDQEISFQGVELEEFHLSPQGISLNAGTRDILEEFLGDLFQDIIDQSLNAALPALPIPSFTIPWSMFAYDLPVFQELGLFNTSMNQTETHITLQGEFGIE